MFADKEANVIKRGRNREEEIKWRPETVTRTNPVRTYLSFDAVASTKILEA